MNCAASAVLPCPVSPTITVRAGRTTSGPSRRSPSGGSGSAAIARAVRASSRNGWVMRLAFLWGAEQVPLAPGVSVAPNGLVYLAAPEVPAIAGSLVDLMPLDLVSTLERLDAGLYRGYPVNESGAGGAAWE